MNKTNNTNNTIWINYLRSFITFLVVVHHAALAYTTFAHFDKSAYIRSTHAIVDAQRWLGLDILVNFNDIFFMSLMFLISGLFLTKSIEKKGAGTFIKDRCYRLFIPFLLGGTALMLLAYYPSYYLANNTHDMFGYIKDFFTLQKWPVGPPWFIWVLFLFNFIFAISFSSARNFYKKMGERLALLKDKPFTLFLIWSGFTWVIYVPLTLLVGKSTWTGLGPFDFQLGRILLYFGYFILGVIFGNSNFNTTVFAHDSKIVRNWWGWAIWAFIAFALELAFEVIRAGTVELSISAFSVEMIYFVIYAASCTLSCIAFITGFKRLISSSSAVWNSFSNNAYMIYLVHFTFVTWCQYFLLEQNMSAIVKFLIVSVVAVAGSWIASILLHKNQLLKKYL